jgi:hypothetical protein
VHVKPSPDLPATQGAQTALEVPVHAATILSPDPHTVHVEHELELSADENWSFSQAVHEAVAPDENSPALQDSHLFVEEFARLPGPQNAHDDWPSVLLTKPCEASHPVQLEDAAPETSPTGHGVHEPDLELE